MCRWYIIIIVGNAGLYRIRAYVQNSLLDWESIRTIWLDIEQDKQTAIDFLETEVEELKCTIQRRSNISEIPHQNIDLGEQKTVK